MENQELFLTDVEPYPYFSFYMLIISQYVVFFLCIFQSRDSGNNSDGNKRPTPGKVISTKPPVGSKSKPPFRSRHQPFQGPKASQSRGSTPDVEQTGRKSPVPNKVNETGKTGQALDAASPIGGSGVNHDVDPTTSGSSPTKILTEASPYPDSTAVSEVPENQLEQQPTPDNEQ